MADLIQAAEQAQRLIQMLQGVDTIAKAMTEVGSLEQACNEVKTRHGVLTAQVADVQADLDAKKAAAQTAVEDSSALVKTARGVAEEVVAAAKEQAASIIAAATAQANEQLHSANARASNVAGEIESAMRKLDGINAAHAAVTIEHARVSALVAQIKGE